MLLSEATVYCHAILIPPLRLSVCLQTRSSQEVPVTMSQARTLFQVCTVAAVLAPPSCHRSIVPEQLAHYVHRNLPSLNTVDLP